VTARFDIVPHMLRTLARSRRRLTAFSIALGLATSLVFTAGCGRDSPESAPASPEPASPRTGWVSQERVEAADREPHNWLAHGRTFGEQRHSPLAMIDDTNVDRLGLAWSFETGTGRGHEATPIVVDGVIYLTAPWSVVHALDARTGEPLWSYDPKVPRSWARRACCDVVNRGVALWQGRVYVGTLDGRLVALDARSGSVVFDVNTIDRDQPYTITGAPRVAKGKILIGNGGAEYGVRGYVSAYDADTGEMAWRFYTVPGDPAKPVEHAEMTDAAATWNGEWWKLGGGGTVWDSMAYDPELDLVYIGTGNGSPWARSLRSPGGGDNLFLSSILALRPDTGELVWHYQTTPADNWDYTAVQQMILTELEWKGETRKVLMQAPKNGFFYVLDRATGELLSAEKYVRVTWASHVDMKTGRPVETDEADYDEQVRVILPSPNGGHLWHPMSYSPATGLVYIPVLELAGLYLLDPDFEPIREAWNLGMDMESYGRVAEKTSMPAAWGELKAWDPVAQKAVWTVKHPGSFNGGVLSTAGNLVFQGTGDGRFAAYAADTGERLFEVLVRVGIVAPPVTYAVDGVQYVSVLAGWGGGGAIEGGDLGISAAGKWENRGRLLTFALDGQAELPQPAALEHTIASALPDLDLTPEQLTRGEGLFNTYCLQCHGILAMTSGVVPDLRYATAEVHDQFQHIVLGGTRTHQGMASFADALSADEVRYIQAYVIERAKLALAAQ
jgi:quinohemoprotein ethanol dehydrogenase